MTGRLLAQLAEVALRDAQAVVDPRYCPDDCDGPPPLREVTPEDIAESQRLTDIVIELDIKAALAGFGTFTHDPFESEEEAEIRRCEEWDRVLP